MILKPFKVQSPNGKTFYEGDAPRFTLIREIGSSAPWAGCKNRVCPKDGACWDAGKCLNPISETGSQP